MLIYLKFIYQINWSLLDIIPEQNNNTTSSSNNNDNNNGAKHDQDHLVRN